MDLDFDMESESLPSQLEKALDALHNIQVVVAQMNNRIIRLDLNQPLAFWLRMNIGIVNCMFGQLKIISPRFRDPPQWLRDILQYERKWRTLRAIVEDFLVLYELLEEVYGDGN